MVPIWEERGGCDTNDVFQSYNFISYQVLYHFAKENVTHTVAERLILPAALDIVNTVLDEKASEKLNLIPLSDNKVLGRSDLISNINSRVNTVYHFRSHTLLMCYDYMNT